MHAILSALITVAILPAPASAPSAHSVGDTSGIVPALQAGGYVILVRHGAAFSDRADTEPFNPDVSKQHYLNDKGKDLAKAFGAAIRVASDHWSSLHEPTPSRLRDRIVGWVQYYPERPWI